MSLKTNVGPIGVLRVDLNMMLHPGKYMVSLAHIISVLNFAKEEFQYQLLLAFFGAWLE